VPLVVAANRDEALARPSTGPRRWEGSPALVAPRDEKAGGTWLGVNAHGLFVGVTNRFAAPQDPGRASRGHLVLSALRHPDARTLHAALAGLRPTDYNAFHLLYADRHGAHLTWSDGERLHQQELAPGLHVLTERSFHAGLSAREAWVRARWPAAAQAEPEALMALLGGHAPEDALPLEAPCVHLPALEYGTRSSMVLTLEEDWDRSRLWWADGPPCTTPFRDLTPLLVGLAPRAA
jgi:uncharacterized protein with NRDE domain